MPQRPHPGPVEIARLARRTAKIPGRDTVARRRRIRLYRNRWLGPTVLYVVDGPDAWSAYLRRAVDRPGWSVARLARESGLHRATIFGWIKEGSSSVTISSVHAIADALGDARTNTLAAAGNVRDEAVERINAQPWSDAKKALAIERLQRIREEERARELADIEAIAQLSEPEAS
jgi:transcriptional regulator with XRE-family HTH domain